ncbi:MAG: cell division protein FtsA [Bacteroidales bacterium]|nr:cell division protein FtsA [Bacteroidales bacterium]
MNNNFNDIVGVVDIGTTKIVALIGKRIESNKFKVLGYGYETSCGVKRGNIINVLSTANSIKNAIEKAQNNAGIRIQNVYVGIAGQNIRTITNVEHVERENPNELITKKEIEELINKQYNVPVKFPEKIIQVIPKSIVIDNEEIEGVENLIGCYGKVLKINFIIVTAQKNNIEAIKLSIENANLQCSGIFLEPIASSKAVLNDYELKKGVIMIDIGGGTSDMAVYYNNMLIHTAVIPFGGNIITSDIKKNFNLTEDIAEYIKVNYGKAIALNEESNKNLVLENENNKEPIVINNYVLYGVIQARVEEILEFIAIELMKVDKIDQNNNVEIVITGGGAKLAHIQQLIKYKLQRNIRLGLPNVYLTSELKEQFKNPQFSTAIGLMILAYEDLDKKGNSSPMNNPQAQPIEEKTNETTENNPQKENGVNKKSKKLYEILFQPLKDFFDDFKVSDSDLEK